MDTFLRGQSSANSSKSKQAASGETAGISNKRVTVPWVEKYRPRSVDDVAYQDEVVSVLKKSLEGADLPNLLFYGPPGTGKTSTILAIARQLFGSDMMKARVLELNASDERGIQVVRDKVKTFAQHAASGVRPDGKPCPAFKLVILDEADSMTPSAQAALRRTMEKETKSTRFCLICNYVSRVAFFEVVVPDEMADKLFEACGTDSFDKLDSTVKEIIAEGHAAAQVINQVHDRVVEMTELNDHQKSAITEKLAIVDKCLCDGADEYLQILSLCSAITFLQSAYRLKGEDTVEAKDITEIAGVVPDEMADKLFEACGTDSFDKLDSTVKEIIAEGHAAAQVINQVHDRIVEMTELNDHQKSAITEKLAIVDKCLCDGADEYLQILSLCSVMMQQFCHAGQT
ncbi:PREDICTED: replication factor C subunit 4-like [Acropora digitifera]|uniref:replication factor C subunit 4-like n=1 Tax=Acropora digitifera TaxID=70779 RepID=UPI00077AED71|nr:PREDICTED: replication factor C subunit 4-like [Acropora digitifera]